MFFVALCAGVHIASDFSSVSETLTFPAGSQPLTELLFNVSITNDTSVEDTENIQLQASVEGGVGTFVVSTADIFIVDDDGEALHCSSGGGGGGGGTDSRLAVDSHYISLTPIIHQISIKIMLSSHGSSILCLVFPDA
jgi:hypothetical protein